MALMIILMFIINNTNLREFVWTHVILAPGASEVGLGAADLAPLPRDPGGLPGSAGIGG